MHWPALEACDEQNNNTYSPSTIKAVSTHYTAYTHLYSITVAGSQYAKKKNQRTCIYFYRRWCNMHHRIATFDYQPIKLQRQQHYYCFRGVPGAASPPSTTNFIICGQLLPFHQHCNEKGRGWTLNACWATGVCEHSPNQLRVSMWYRLRTRLQSETFLL